MVHPFENENGDRMLINYSGTMCGNNKFQTEQPGGGHTPVNFYMNRISYWLLSERIWCSVNKTKCSTRENAGFARNTRMYSGTEKLHPLIRQKTAESALNYYLCVSVLCIVI